MIYQQYPGRIWKESCEIRHQTGKPGEPLGPIYTRTGPEGAQSVSAYAKCFVSLKVYFLKFHFLEM